MKHRASRSAPTHRRKRRIVLISLALVGISIATFVMGWPLTTSTASNSSAASGHPTTSNAPTESSQPPPPPISSPETQPPSPLPTESGQSPTPTSEHTTVDASDGVIPDGSPVSVFNRQTPAVARLDLSLLSALRRAATTAQTNGVALRVNSGWRSPAYQQQLLQDAVAEYGSLEEAARWVATAQTSAHVSGDAVDIGPPDAATWLAHHGAVYGLCQIYGNEPWHFELRPNAVNNGCPPKYADPTHDPRMQP